MRPSNWSETLNAIVVCYRQGAPEREQERLWWLAEGLPFKNILHRIGQARLPDGRRHPHQRRLRQSVLDACTAGLLAAEPKIRAAGRFFHLFQLIETIFQPIRGAGELAVYDAADRLRHRLGLESENLVYLHAGTRVGARRLAGGRLESGDGWSILHSQLPKPLQTLSTHEAEDVLCIFKDELLASPEVVRARWDRSVTAACGGGIQAIC